MSDIVLDCKGLPCPQPVLRCKDCIEKESPDAFALIVDNEAARENVTRFAGTKGYTAQASSLGDGLIRVDLSRQGAAQAPAEQGGECEVCKVMSSEELAQLSQQIAVFIRSDVMGSGDDYLGAKLMQNFINTLPELGDELWRIVMVNAGVKLAVQGSPVLEKLKEIQDNGVTILVCGTCLDHFGLLEQKVVGETTNMLDVVTSLQLATKVIAP